MTSPLENTSSHYSSGPRQQEYERSCAALIESAPDIVFITDAKGRFLFINQTAQTITGHTHSFLLDSSLQEIAAPEYREAITDNLLKLSRSRDLPLQEIDILSSNQTRIPLEIHLRPFFDRKNRLTALYGIARDITERRKIMNSLHGSADAYLSVIEHTRESITIIQDSIIRFINQALVDMFGYTREEMVENSIFDMMPASSKETLTRIYKQKLQEKELGSPFEIQLECKDGTIKEVEVRGFKIEFEGKMCDLAVMNDVSNYKQAERALENSQNIHQTLVENLNQVIFTLDREGKFSYVSPSLERHGFYVIQDLMGEPFEKFVHPEDENLVRSVLKKMKPGRNKSIKLRFVLKDGSVRHLRASICALIDDNGKQGSMGILADITDQQTAQQKMSQAFNEAQSSKAELKAVIDNAPDIAIQGYTSSGEVIFWNPCTQKLFNIKEADALGKNVKEIMPFDDETHDFVSILEEVIKRDKPSPHLEWPITLHNGTTKYIQWSIFPAARTGKESIAVAMAQDITARKQSEAKILKMDKQLSRFAQISADIFLIEDEQVLFDYITQAVVEISDFTRVLISYFIKEPPFREIIGSKGVDREDLERIKHVPMPREKYLSYFEKGIKIGNQSCYIPYDMKHILDSKAVISGKQDYPSKPGAWHREDNLLVAMRDSKGQIIGMISVDDSKSGLASNEETVRPIEILANLISEIIHKRRLEKKVSESEEKYRDLISNIKVGIFRANPEGTLLEVNPTMMEVFGYSDLARIMSLRTVDLFKNPSDYQPFIQELEVSGFLKSKEFRMKKPDDTTFWASLTSSAVKDSNEKILYFDTVVEDITESKQLREQVKRHSITDDLTGLYNRRYYNENLPKAIYITEKMKSSLSLIMVDIDDFKKYNDSFLHLKGDEVIKKIAFIISQNVRRDRGPSWENGFDENEFALNDWGSRYGGDEFAVILPGTEAAEAKTVAERIRKAFAETTFFPQGKEVHKTVSIGISSCGYAPRKTLKPERRTTSIADYERVAHDLTTMADKALYSAKHAGKNRIMLKRKILELSR